MIQFGLQFYVKYGIIISTKIYLEEINMHFYKVHYEKKRLFRISGYYTTVVRWDKEITTESEKRKLERFLRKRSICCLKCTIDSIIPISEEFYQRCVGA